MGERYGVEVETRPNDVQALARRLSLKVRDGAVDGVLLVLPSTRHVDRYLRLAGDALAASFPVAGEVALERLSRGLDPGGSAIVLLSRRQ